MLKNVENEADEEITGYYFEDDDGDRFIAGVEFDTVIRVTGGTGDFFDIYKEDIPRLIKVLEAAYNHKESL